MDEVARSIRVTSTSVLSDTLREAGFVLGGFVAGEGCFYVTRKLPPHVDGCTRLRFVFQVKIAQRDRHLLEALRDLLGYGSIEDRAPRKEGWQPESSFTIASLKAHHAATIPFADTFLLPCAKRRQFERWRDAMAAYETIHPVRRGRSTCSEPGCDLPVRGRGLCRSHYYRVTGY